MARVTRQRVLEMAHETLDEFDREDVDMIVDILLEGYSPLEIMSWLFFLDSGLEGTPLIMLAEGRTREVTLRARRMVEQRCHL